MAEKIYITSLHFRHGGVEMCITNLANALIEKGYDVEILTSYNLCEPVYPINEKVKITYLTQLHPNKEEFQKAIASKNPIRILKEGMYAVKVLTQKKKTMKNAIKNITDGTIISTRNEHSVLLSKYGQSGVKKIAQLHHDHNFNKKLINDFRHHYNNIDYFLLLTDRLTHEVQDFMSGYNTKTIVKTMENFLPEQVTTSADIIKEKQVVAVGRLDPVKGFSRLIDIWEKVNKECPEWKLKIIGGGNLFSELLNKINKMKLQDSIELTGELSHDKVLEEMQKSSIYAMTSLSEGFPFVLIEAQMCKTPAVAFDIRVGPRAIVENEKEGYLIKDNDIDAFAEKIKYLMKNDIIRNQYSENAYNKSKQFSKENIMKKWIEIL